MSASRFFRTGGFSFGAFFLVALMISSVAIFSGCKKKEEMPPKQEAPVAAPEAAAPGPRARQVRRVEIELIRDTCTCVPNYSPKELPN